MLKIECHITDEPNIKMDQDRIDFFNMLPGRKTIQLFKDNEKCLEYPRFFHFDFDIYTRFEWILKLETLNDRGMGVYLCVNETDGKGRKKENVTRVRAAVADLDGAPLEPVWQYKPTMVIETSPGKYHAYWRVDDVPLEGFKQLQQAIAYNLGSDPKVCDLPRVFRIPGFFHQKEEPFLSKIIHYMPDAIYTFRELSEMFPPEPVKKWTAPAYQHKTDSNPDDPFRGNYGASKPGRNVHVMARLGGCKKRNLPWAEIEAEAFKEGGACSPPLSEREIRGILKSFKRYRKIT
jgi:hypothetical protein